MPGSSPVEVRKNLIQLPYGRLNKAPESGDRPSGDRLGQGGQNLGTGPRIPRQACGAGGTRQRHDRRHLHQCGLRPDQDLGQSRGATRRPGAGRLSETRHRFQGFLDRQAPGRQQGDALRPGDRHSRARRGPVHRPPQNPGPGRGGDPRRHCRSRGHQHRHLPTDARHPGHSREIRLRLHHHSAHC